MTLVITTADVLPWKGHARQFALLRDHRFTALGAWAQMEAAHPEVTQELLTDRRQSE
jgi:hypothetical protein